MESILYFDKVIKTSLVWFGLIQNLSGQFLLCQNNVYHFDNQSFLLTILVVNG